MRFLAVRLIFVCCLNSIKAPINTSKASLLFVCEFICNRTCVFSNVFLFSLFFERPSKWNDGKNSLAIMTFSVCRRSFDTCSIMTCFRSDCCCKVWSNRKRCGVKRGKEIHCLIKMDCVSQLFNTFMMVHFKSRSAKKKMKKERKKSK